MTSNPLTENYRRWFEYEKEVHDLTLASLESVPRELRLDGGFQKAVSLFAHIIAARSMWLHRFGITCEPVALFPANVTLNDLPSSMRRMNEAWSQYLKSLSDADLLKEFEYQSYEGPRFRSSIGDILTQLFGHSWYHRGQIAQLLRSIGAEPAVTDFVFWSRVPL